MDSSNDIYYSDSAHIIDNGNSEWLGNTVLIENNGLNWQEDGPEITVDYSENAVDDTLTENDSYLSANPDDSSETSQYFSILNSSCDDTEADVEADEQSVNNAFTTVNTSNAKCVVNVEIGKEEVILPDITNKIEDDQHEHETIDNDKISNEQVILYRMEGSDDLYAVQIADDGNGNLQKYQYKVRQTEDGQLEAVPGSIEIQSADTNVLESQEDEEPEEEIQEEQEEEEELIDIKPIPGLSTIFNTAEEEEEEDEEANMETASNFYMNTANELNAIDSEYLLQQSSYDQDQDEEDYQTVEGVHITGDSESITEQQQQQQPNDNNLLEPVFIKTQYKAEETSESEYEIEALDEDFQDEFYEKSPEDDEQVSQILQHKEANLSNNVTFREPVKEINQPQVTDNCNVTIFKDDKHLSYLVVKTKEKENISIVNNKTNLRSILKSNYPTNKLKNSLSIQQAKHVNILPTIITNKEVKMHVQQKDGGKQQQQQQQQQIEDDVVAKSVRQPRKQTIKPIDRVGSEIIVQPLIYSLDGTVPNEASEPPVTGPGRRKRVVREIYQVSDESDPEFTLKPIKKRKFKRNKYARRKKPIEITIDDSDDEEESISDSNNSVIEVLTDEEQEDKQSEANMEETQSVQRRSSIDSDSVEEKQDDDEDDDNDDVDDEDYKNDDDEDYKNDDDDDEDDYDDTKIQQTEEKQTKKEAAKKTISPKKNKCPMCPKTFPRQITLKRHMNIHTTRRNLRSQTSIMTTSTTNSEVSKDLLQTKQQQQQQSEKEVKKVKQIVKFNCVKCKLTFLLESQYKRHQTVHTLKQNGNRKTSPAKETFKCEYCGQMFAQRTQLSVHRNTHKTFPCPNCNTTFTAKLLLDDHMRKNCVKLSSPRRKPQINSTNKQTFKCDNCQQVFPTMRSLQIHHSVAHKNKNKSFTNRQLVKTISTSSSLPNKSQLLRKKPLHTGVPVSLKMKKAFDKMKLKT